MIDRQFKAIAFRGEGKDIEAYVVDCVLAEDCAALIQRAREEALDHAWGVIDHYCFMGKLGITREEAFQIRDAIRAAGLGEGEKP